MFTHDHTRRPSIFTVHAHARMLALGRELAMEVSLRLFTPWLLLVALSFTACSASDSPSTTTTSQRTSPPATGTAVQVSVSVSDPDHDRHLHYRWAATEGTINTVDR